MFKNINNQQIQEISAYIFMIIFMFAILHFHVIPAVLAGLLAYVMTTKLMHQLSVKIPSDSTQSKVVGMFVGLGSLGLISFLVFILIKALNGENMTDMTNTVIETINQKYGNTVIIVTHNDAIKLMADKVIKLRDGNIRKEYENTEKVNAEELDW